jgi:aspartyl/asparaginyl-tRNA synthetase
VTGAVRADSRAQAATRSTRPPPVPSKAHDSHHAEGARRTSCSIAGTCGSGARQQAILRVRHEVINAVRDYFNERDFILADTPIHAGRVRGTTTLFPVRHFEATTATSHRAVNFTTSQLWRLAAYCFGPTFAEKSKTRRHLTEF